MVGWVGNTIILTSINNYSSNQPSKPVPTDGAFQNTQYNTRGIYLSLIPTRISDTFYSF